MTDAVLLLFAKGEERGAVTRIRLRHAPDQKTDLVFVDRDGMAQKCSDCWFHWFDTHLCQHVPCNSQDRDDGRVGTWQETERKATR